MRGSSSLYFARGSRRKYPVPEWIEAIRITYEVIRDAMGQINRTMKLFAEAVLSTDAARRIIQASIDEQLATLGIKARSECYRFIDQEYEMAQRRMRERFPGLYKDPRDGSEDATISIWDPEMGSWKSLPGVRVTSMKGSIHGSETKT